jgi:hypothetical protein
MTQATDLGGIANQSRTAYRGRVNVGFQALASLNAGTSAPSPTYPNMLWADTSINQIKIRNGSNTVWTAIGTIDPFQLYSAAVPPVPDEIPTGFIMFYISNVSPSGWLFLNDGTIGDSLSNATARASADSVNLFSVLWSNSSNTWLPIYDSSGSAVSRGGSAIADFNAHRRLSLPRIAGRVLGGAGIGSGLTFREAFQYIGEESHLLNINEMPAHTHSYTGNLDTGELAGAAGSGLEQPGSKTSGSTGGGQPHNIIQPTTFLWAHIKL